MNRHASEEWKQIQRHLGIDADGIPGRMTSRAVALTLGLRNEPRETSGNIPELVAKFAEGEIGVREHPKDSNKGKRVREYQDADWLDGTGYPWCASFVDWCVMRAGEIEPLPFRRPRTAGAWDFERWANQQDLDMKKPPKMADIKRGDILVYTFSHIGICTGEADVGQIETVEGNTDDRGSREGGGVYRKSRRLSQIRSRIRL